LKPIEGRGSGQKHFHSIYRDENAASKISLKFEKIGQNVHDFNKVTFENP
jgi:hypothetical protein